MPLASTWPSKNLDFSRTSSHQHHLSVKNCFFNGAARPRKSITTTFLRLKDWDSVSRHKLCICSRANYNHGFSHVIYGPSQAVHFPNYSDLTTEAVATPQTVEALRSPWERTWLRFAGQAWLHAAEPVGRSEGQPSPGQQFGIICENGQFLQRAAFVSTNAKMEKSGVVRLTIWVATFGPRPPSAPWTKDVRNPRHYSLVGLRAWDQELSPTSVRLVCHDNCDTESQKRGKWVSEDRTETVENGFQLNPGVIIGTLAGLGRCEGCGGCGGMRPLWRKHMEVCSEELLHTVYRLESWQKRHLTSAKCRMLSQRRLRGTQNCLDIYSIQVINYTSSTGPNDTIQNDPNQLAEHQLQYFLVSKQLFHTLSRHNRSAFDLSQPEAMPMWSVPIYLFWAMFSEPKQRFCLSNQKILCCFHSLEAFSCVPQRLIVAVAVGAAELVAGQQQRVGTPWVHEKVKRNDMTKGTRKRWNHENMLSQIDHLCLAYESSCESSYSWWN